MGDEVGLSWLSSLIDQADKLILWTGGLGKDQVEHAFSDDESDGSSTLDDEEDEQALAQPQTVHNPDKEVNPRREGHASVASPGGEEKMAAAVEKGDNSHEGSASQSYEMHSNQGGSAGAGQDKPDTASLLAEDYQGNSHHLALASIRKSSPAKEGTNSSSPGLALTTPAVDRQEGASTRLSKVAVGTEVVCQGGDDISVREEGQREASLRHRESISRGDGLHGPLPFETPSRNRGREDQYEAANNSCTEYPGGASQDVSRSKVALDPSLVTPFRSREQSCIERGPPLVGVLPAGGNKSRRVNRSRNGEKAGRGPARVPRIGTDPIAQSVGHRSPSPSDVPSVEKARPASMGRKKFTFMSDTSWLKPRDAPDDAMPAPLRPTARAEVATDGRAGASFIAPAARESGWRSAPLVGTGHASSSPPSVREERELSLEMVALEKDTSEMEKQRKQDMASAAYPEPESGLGVGEIRNYSRLVPQSATDDHPEEGDRQPDGLKGDISDVNVQEEDNERSDGLKSDVSDEIVSVHNEEDGEIETQLRESGRGQYLAGEEGGAMIGAKRASAENGKVPHNSSPTEDWSLTPPEAFAPSKRESKRGKTQQELHRLAVMRHSSRLDDAILEQHRKIEAMSKANGSQDADTKGFNNRELKNGDTGDLLGIPWPDKALRPYDSPIVDMDLPARQAQELVQHGFGKDTLILCSPFRRCLQTAGVVARTLGVAGVTVHLEIGERMDKVRKEMAEEMEHRAQKHEDESSDALSKEPLAQRAFCYLEEVDMVKELGEGVRLEEIVGEQPPTDETGVEAKARFINTIAKVREKQLREGPVLVVAHGDTLNAAGESLASQIVFEADYCAWAVFDLDDHFGHLADSYGIQMIPL